MKTRRLLAALAGLALLAGPAAAQTAPERWMSLRSMTPLPPVRDTGRWKSGDVELYYAVYGEGPPVVLLHPGLGSADYWANQVGPLSQEFQVVVIDLRGHGRSTASSKPFTYALLADDVLHIIKGLHLKKPAVVGWGDGATVGLELARHHPDRIGKLIAFGLTWNRTGQRADADRAQTFIDYVHKAAEDYKALAPAGQSFEATLDQLETLWLNEPNYTEADLKAVDVPTTIIAAEHDEWVRIEHMTEAAALIPDARVVVIPDASHFAPWQAPKPFNDALKLLLRN